MSYLAEMRKKGKYDHYAWPGGYPLFYVTKDGGVLCPTCANENAELCQDKDDPQWYIVATDANWEDPDLYCDHCNKRIESAYADDDAPTAKRGRRTKPSRKTSAKPTHGYAPPRSAINKLKDKGYQISISCRTKEEAQQIAEQFRKQGALAQVASWGNNPVAIDRRTPYAVMYKFKPQKKRGKR